MKLKKVIKLSTFLTSAFFTLELSSNFSLADGGRDEPKGGSGEVVINKNHEMHDDPFTVPPRPVTPFHVAISTYTERIDFVPAGVTSLNIPNSVSEISHHAFDNSSDLDRGGIYWNNSHYRSVDDFLDDFVTHGGEISD